MTDREIDATATVVGLARTLRAAGVAVGAGQVAECVRALALLDPVARDDVYWAGRLTLCSGLEDLERYERVFPAYFTGVRPRQRHRRGDSVRMPDFMAPVPAAEGATADPSAPSIATAASATEALRHRDFAALSDAERAVVARLLDAFRLPGELRRTRRRRPARQGRVDRARTVRELLRRGGEPARLRHTTVRHRPRRVVLLVDVSGSMSLYASALLRFAHVAAQRSRGQTEVFTIGTRLTRITRELTHRDPDRAMAAVSAAIPDWSGGTRLGVLLKEFLDTWGQRGLARGAIVVILSDGWERGDAAVLGEQMGRLGRLAHRIVWANPRKAGKDYQPLVGGMAAALPHVHDFVEGHSLAALQRLAAVVAGRDSGLSGRRQRRLADTLKGE